MTQKMPQKFWGKNQPTKKCPESSKSLGEGGGGGGGVGPFWKNSIIKRHFFLWGVGTSDSDMTQLA